MSIKKKVSGKQMVKKPAPKPAKKPSKPVTKVPAKKSNTKAPKKAIVSKKPIKKAVKPIAKKPAQAKKIVKKVVKTVQKAVKKIVKPAPVKKVLVAKAPEKKPLAKVQTKPVKANNINGNQVPKQNKPLPPTSGGKAPVTKTGKVLIAQASKASEKEIPASRAKQEDPKKLAAARKSNEVLAITNTIPATKKNEISPSKIASISHSITNPVRKTDSYAVKPEKEPAGKFEMEFVFHSSSEMLYEFLSTASGLSEWFCDDLNIRNGIYTFIWDDQLQQARLLKTVELHIVRFQWVEKTDGSYFEFKIQKDDLTNDIALIITDFGDSVSERESSKLLWQSQIEKLRHVIGSIF